MNYFEFEGAPGKFSLQQGYPDLVSLTDLPLISPVLIGELI